jgi:two-component system phosphate regulon response regulator OmpR
MTDVAKTQLWVVDDEPELRSLLADYLSLQGFEVRLAEHAAQARTLFAQAPSPPALVILDIQMPGESGLSLRRWLHSAYPRTAVIMLTANDDGHDRVESLEDGADDYITKPFDPRELLARIRAVLRRSALATTAPAPAASSIPFGECQLDIQNQKLWGPGGTEIDITAAEYHLLALLARHPDQALSRNLMMSSVFGRNWDVFDRSIDLHIMRLRRKIERNPDKPEVIKTVRHVGYMFVSAAG